MRLGNGEIGEWEWFEWCERVGKLGCFWKMNGNVVGVRLGKG